MSPSTIDNPVILPTTSEIVEPDEREQVIAMLKGLSTELIEFGPSLSEAGTNLWKRMRDLAKRSPMDIAWEDVHSVISIWRQIRITNSSRLPASGDKIDRLEQLRDSLKLRFGYPDVREGERDENRNRTLKLTWCGRKYRDANPSSKGQDLDVVESTCCLPSYKTPALFRRGVEKATSVYFDQAHPPSEMLWQYLRSVKQKIEDRRRDEFQCTAGASGDELSRRFTTVYETLQTSLWSELSGRQEPVPVVFAFSGAEGGLGSHSGVPHLTESESAQVAETLEHLLMPSIHFLLSLEDSGSGVSELLKSFEEWTASQERGAIYSLLNYKRHGLLSKGEDFLILSNLTAAPRDVRTDDNKGLGRSFRRLLNLHREAKVGKTFPEGNVDDARNKIIRGLKLIHGISLAKKEMTFSVTVFEDSEEESRNSHGASEVPERFTGLTFCCGSPPTDVPTAFLDVDAPAEKIQLVVESLVSGYRDPDNSLLESRFLALAGQTNHRQLPALSGAVDTTQVADSTVPTDRRADLMTSVHTLLETIEYALRTPPLSQPSVHSVQNSSRKRPFGSISVGSFSANSAYVSQPHVAAPAKQH
ncbi:hypothetical protein QFC20_002862 [Naganishia adeliensis]|uniref:Uncharacterized protein n=1 Tax=Naganishia adeliensis TaxID=92952 RepID=A0ACC2WHA0_9TREE|nr:hypothetical protein QFC20_002862 [Naganishia adeliensis]